MPYLRGYNTTGLGGFMKPLMPAIQAVRDFAGRGGRAGREGGGQGEGGHEAARARHPGGAWLVGGA